MGGAGRARICTTIRFPAVDFCVRQGDATRWTVSETPVANVCDPNYRLKDGDAAFLDAGTPIYQVNGQPPAQQLAARFNGQIAVYRAMTPTS